MRQMNIAYIFSLLLTLLSCGGDEPAPSQKHTLSATPLSLNFSEIAQSSTIDINSTKEWGAYSNEDWISFTPSSSLANETKMTVTVTKNSSNSKRNGSVVIRSGDLRQTVEITQEASEVTPPDPSITAPEGYTLVWHDEFNEGTRPSATNWSYETGGGGWGNNELQHYVAGSIGSEQLASVNDGIFKIVAKKIGSTVYSIRINSKESWTYGYFEAKLRLPSGKGTWPAFWMMPKNFTSWPEDGEIDIMEEVGYRPNWVSSAIHCKSYHHSINTEKTAERFLETAQSEYHIYALEWTEDYIKTFVDGTLLFTFMNDKKGNKDTWPFYTPFYLKLNLAWGGNWGGAQGVDESALPATYEIDYVRVFQKSK
ncbi:MAG: family 16 glycosylhydrolase [Bacteroidales bacterium]